MSTTARRTYRVGNNTDYAGNPFVTRNRHEAERVDREYARQVARDLIAVIGRTFDAEVEA